MDEIKRIAVIGCGAAGGMVSLLLSKNPYCSVVAFDLKEPFSTLLPTGGGRCNLTHCKDDVREFVKNYPRGEKFLISVFSKFDYKQTRKLFSDLGIKTYVQEDNRVFPVSNSSLQTVKILNSHLNNSNFQHKKEKVIFVEKVNDIFFVHTDCGKYEFDKVVLSTGGKGEGHRIAKNFGHNIISPKPALTSLDVKEKFLYKLSGMTFKNVSATIKFAGKKFPHVSGDILFSHKSITGPCVFKVSSLCAFEEFNENSPLEITFDLIENSVDDIEREIKNNAKKSVKNVFSKFAPENFITEILNFYEINADKQISQIKKNEKQFLINSLKAFKVYATGRIKGSEIVMAGGVDLNEVNSKNFESKIIPGLYFAGEILNIDAFTGGFNLQNCWSAAYIISRDFNG